MGAFVDRKIIDRKKSAIIVHIDFSVINFSVINFSVQTVRRLVRFACRANSLRACYFCRLFTTKLFCVCLQLSKSLSHLLKHLRVVCIRHNVVLF